MQGRCREDTREIGLTSEGAVVRAVAAKPPRASAASARAAVAASP